jgi:hypothetical protein
MKCKICNNDSKEIFTAKILGKYNIKYFNCPVCGFLQTEEPFWLDEAYTQAISSLDTGAIERNISFSKLTSVLIYFLFNRNGRFLDFGGGHGVFTRMMRDIGFDFYWDDFYAQNIFADGFEYKKDQKIELVTAFECFEHFVNPKLELESLFKISSNILFSTGVLPDPIPAPGKWWYYCFETGQHISFYSSKTLKFIAKKYGLNIYSWGGLHLFTKKNLNAYVFNKILHHSKKWLFNYVNKRMSSLSCKDHEFIKESISGKRVNENTL